MASDGVNPVRRNESRARSTASPRATTKPIAASMSTMAARLPTSGGPPGYYPGRPPRHPSAKALVRGQGGVDLADPGGDPTVHVHRVLETGRLDRGQRFGAADTGLAVQDDLAVLRQFGQGRAVEDVALGYEDRTGDLHDLVL